jgi:FkbM family methyltransferase
MLRLRILQQMEKVELLFKKLHWMKFVRQEKIAKVDFIKADIEGAEPDMLRGAVGILKEHFPKLLSRTYHNPNHPLPVGSN